ncbi:MAG: hypothetical protein RBS39_02965 [Phycisphaerales bacterium]|jgi:tetratricopeptide (TPR) repeat protein|nr:hypothetical protein [Phycisphaerales bacterium]
MRTSAASLPGIVLLILLCVAGRSRGAAPACLWDDDALRAEIRGMEGTLAALTGRFDRFPAEYYEARIRIAESRLGADPGDLSAYDNAGVACDRLGRTDEAMEWMVRKRAALDASGIPDAEHEYRYLANLGTFYAHRWIRSGADRAGLGDLIEAERLISAAIELNPDAHFGRERYQLLAIRALIDPPNPEAGFFSEAVPTIFEIDPAVRGHQRWGWWDARVLESTGYADAIEGLVGLIVLGNAWQSYDIHHSLAAALHDAGYGQLAMVAEIRMNEIADEGGRSLLRPDQAPLVVSQRWGETARTGPEYEREVREWFDAACTEAKAWSQSRNDYVLARLARGEHPDTHTGFWDAWTSPSEPPLAPNGFFGRAGNAAAILKFQVVGIASLIAIAGGVIVFVRLRLRTHRARLA